MGTQNPLLDQLDKIWKHDNIGSYGTHFRYKDSENQFIRHLSEEFKLQKLENVKQKHIDSFVKMRIEEGASKKTILNDLSAIRHFHDLTGSRNRIDLKNETVFKRLGMKPSHTERQSQSKTWSNDQVSEMINLAKRLDRPDIALALDYADKFGLRIHETTRLTKGQLENALNNGVLDVRGKNGKDREAPVTERGRALIQDTLKKFDHLMRNGKIFVQGEIKTHQEIKAIQNFVYNHRDVVADKGKVEKITYHGIRHKWAHGRYEYHLERLGDEKAARLAVSKELGHERDEVTKVYLK